MEASASRKTRSQWLEDLREQFLRLAARRVDALHVEDLVQDALKIVVEKAPNEHPDLAWCFQVLRHTIGNHYRREQTRRRWVEQDPEGEKMAQAVAASTLEELDRREMARLLRACVDELGAPEDQCRSYMTRMLDGAEPHELAEEAGLDAAVLYRRLYRCRQRLREILVRKGIRS